MRATCSPLSRTTTIFFRAGRIAGTDAACGVAATLPRSAYYDALQLNYYVREAFATGWLLLRGN